MANSLIGRDMAVDLGTANTLVYVRGKGVLLDEPSVVALNDSTGEILAVGHEAKRMIGRTPDNIASMKVYLKDEKLRDAVNKAWLKMFPDEHDRPARHALKVELRGEVLFQIEVIAVL